MRDYRARVSKRKCRASGICWLIVLALYVVDVLSSLWTTGVSIWYLLLMAAVAAVDIFWWYRYFAYDKKKGSDDTRGENSHG